MRNLRMIMFAAAYSLLLAAMAPAQSQSIKDQQIDLLKRRLEKAQAETREERIARLVYETQINVAHQHDFKVGDPLEFAPLTREVIEKIFRDSIAEQYPGRGFELYTWLLKFFGAVPDDMDLMKFMEELIGEQAGGLYDPFSKKLYISPAFDVSGTLGRMILAHEICHAQQDVTFDLKGMGIFEPDNGDRTLAIMAIVEGDATLMMSEVQAQSGSPLAILLELPKMLTIDQRKLNEAPAILRESMLFPYLNGAAFFQALRGRTREGQGSMGDPSWRNAVFLDPPTSTEQILHPEKYLSNEQPAEVPSLEEAEKEADHSLRDVAGEYGIRLLLRPHVGSPRATAAAEGWNGDRLVVTETNDRSKQALQWVTRWDTDEDAREFQAALQEALTARFKADGIEWKSADDGATASFAGKNLEIYRSTHDTVWLRAEVSAPGR